MYITWKTINNTTTTTVADPGFPRGGSANSRGGHQHTNLPYFPEKCMKLKEFGPPGGRPSRPPLRSATALQIITYLNIPSPKLLSDSWSFINIGVSHLFWAAIRVFFVVFCFFLKIVKRSAPVHLQITSWRP